MAGTARTRSMQNTPFLRPVWLPTVVTGIVLLVALGILVGMSWQGLQRLDPVQAQMATLARLQRATLDVEKLFIAQVSGKGNLDSDQVMQVRRELEQLQGLERQMAPKTAQQLQRAWLALNTFAASPRDALIASLTAISRVLTVESQAHQRLVAEARRDTEFEFRIAAGTLIVLPLVAMGTLFLLRRRFLDPLNELGTLMTLLARQDYSPASSHSVDPVLQPLFENYNQLVMRLADLEEQNRVRRQSLENQIRAATHALLEQQRELAAAERLAAVGEVTAGLAHELRNPLAGIQMALNNLNQEISDVDQGNRLRLVINELNRISELLSATLSQTRQEPEALREVNLAKAVAELVTLVRYQIGNNIQLSWDVPDELICRLPEGRLHQALLNLVLNAAQAIDMDRHGSIVIRGFATPGEHFLLSVSDDGPGFPQHFLDNGLRPFISGRIGGTGLGLAVVQRFIHDLGGTMRIENPQSGGACVMLTLPCRGKHE